ncbi:MAG: DUF1330 domain-containing protein [Cyanobacteria bacterium]|nr:DUF1330 domain-containing protein [Cyanobacteriota bacterium]
MSTMITIGTLNPGGEVHLQRYANQVIPLLEKAGVNIRGRFKGTEALVGEDYPDLVAVMEFPNVQSMKEFLASDSYQLALAHRIQAFKTIHTFACETLL